MVGAGYFYISFLDETVRSLRIEQQDLSKLRAPVFIAIAILAGNVLSLAVILSALSALGVTGALKLAVTVLGNLWDGAALLATFAG